MLITGVTGLLGKYLVGSADPNIQIHGVSRGSWPKALDVSCFMHLIQEPTTSALIDLLAEVRPDALIVAAAEGSVDAVEGRAADHQRLNVELPSHLAAFCASRGISFVHISSNAVFGGSDIPYADASPFTPVNDYGRLKAAAEDAVRAANPQALIARPILMYGWPFFGGRINPVVHWVTEIRQGRVVRVVDDVITEPLAAWDCADAIWHGLDRGLIGGFNISGGEPVTLYDFALLTCEAFGLDAGAVERIPSASLAGLAPRPRNTRFDLVRLRDEFGIEPTPVRDGLFRMAANENQSA